MIRITRAFCAGILCATAMLLPATAQAPAPLDDAGRSATVAKAADLLRNRYIFPETGEAAAKKLEERLAAGAYKDLGAGDFAQRLTADLYEVAKDKHMRVSAAGVASPPPTGGAPMGPPPASEGGIVRADKLAGNIGYIEISGFPPPAAFKPALDRAMAALKDTKALIVDVRRNGGGSPETGAYFVSHFVDAPEPIVLMDFINRTPGTKEFTSRPSMSSKTPTTYYKKPVYVLTSARTFSGGEGTSYMLQAMKIATIVGETTGGGANPGGVMPIGPQLGLFMPGGRPVNPITRTNWEGVGVIPDIPTKAGDALKAALEKLGEKPAAGDINTLSRAKLFAPRSTPLPGTEAMLRKMLDQLARGEPDYNLMAPGLQNATREQLPMLQSRLKDLGPLKSVTFVGPGPQGGDTYDAEFEKGGQRWTLSLSADGKVDGSRFGPLPPKN